MNFIKFENRIKKNNVIIIRENINKMNMKLGDIKINLNISTDSKLDKKIKYYNIFIKNF